MQRTLTRLALLIATAVVLAAASAAAIAATTSGRVLVPGCLKAHFKPTQLMLGCDGSNYLKGLKWTKWTHKHATATAIDEVDDCQPDCATGHFHAYPVAVAVSRPRTCPKLTHKVFRHIVLTYANQHPPGGRIQSGPLFCPI
jgi:hypothetical protein